ncbi:hypothetical protein NHF48_010555 [Sphingomonas sp. H160509]|uniref:hypothetical protein n=1 Tax=Sphingomonas sp. H160509 TaxID=2955313 RepID=UPI00209808B7|nr:hypothetical protein [Sphingomonas sp. H160509]MDD1451307.1 hypothetical protein [Sphingomonas sp. H160509]
MAKEAVGAPGVRSGDRHALRVECVDHRGAGAFGQQRELGVERRVDLARRECRANIGVFAEHDRQQAIGLQLGFEQAKVAPRLLDRTHLHACARVLSGALAVDRGDSRDDRAKRRERHQHRQRRDEKGRSESDHFVRIITHAAVTLLLKHDIFHTSE